MRVPTTMVSYRIVLSPSKFSMLHLFILLYPPSEPLATTDLLTVSICSSVTQSIILLAPSPHQDAVQVQLQKFSLLFFWLASLLPGSHFLCLGLCLPFGGSYSALVACGELGGRLKKRERNHENLYSAPRLNYCSSSGSSSGRLSFSDHAFQLYFIVLAFLQSDSLVAHCLQTLNLFFLLSAGRVRVLAGRPGEKTDSYNCYN